MNFGIKVALLDFDEKNNYLLARSQPEFNEYVFYKNITDENVEDYVNVAFISIMGTNNHYADHWFTGTHSNVLNIRFDDITQEEEYDGQKLILFNDEHAKKIVDFVQRNAGRNFLVHCAAGISRSGAVIEYIRRFYPEYDIKSFPIWNPQIRPNPVVLQGLARNS